MRELERVITEAKKPKLYRVVAYPESKENGKVTFKHEKVYKSDSDTVIRALQMIKEEIKPLGKYMRSYPELRGLSQEELDRKYEERN